VLIRLISFLIILPLTASLITAQSQVISVDDGDEQLLYRALPVYPPLAKAARVEGSVQLTLAVDAEGHVTEIVAISGHPLLRKAAAETAMHYQYNPFHMNGKPAAVFVRTDILFNLVAPNRPSTPFPPVADIASVVMAYSDGRVSVTVSGDGLVRYLGVSDVLVEGEHVHHVSPENLQSLLSVFRDADFFSLKDDYSVGATDVGQTRTSIRIGGKSKTILDDWVEVPHSLKKVQDALLQYSGSNEWTKGNADTIPNILAETPDRRAQRELLSTLLPKAAMYSDLSVLKAILKQKVNVDRLGPWDASALTHAAGRGLPEMVRALLQAGASPSKKDHYGRGALIFGAGSGSSEVVQLLISAGASPTEGDEYGDTPLMAAAAAGNPDSVRILLAHGAPVNAKNSRRQTALLSAGSGDSGFGIGEMDRKTYEVPEDLVHRDRVVRQLIDAGADINVHGWFGNTALFSLEEDTVKELLAHHIDIEARNDREETALIDTVSEEIADLLIKGGANVNAVDKDGRTALMLAAMRNYVDKVSVLVKARNIKLNIRDRAGQTALDIAQKLHNDDCVRILIGAGATPAAQ